MRHALNDHTRYHNPADRLHAIAYEKEYVQRMISEVGFDIVESAYGTWAGGSGTYQDLMVLQKRS